MQLEELCNIESSNQGPGPGPRPGGWKNAKSKIDLRLRKICTGCPVCADRSVSARRYDRSDFRITKNYAAPQNGKTEENLENRGKSDFTPSRFPWVALFFHLEIPMRYESPDPPVKLVD